MSETDRHPPTQIHTHTHTHCQACTTHDTEADTNAHLHSYNAQDAKSGAPAAGSYSLSSENRKERTAVVPDSASVSKVTPRID